MDGGAVLLGVGVAAVALGLQVLGARRAGRDRERLADRRLLRALVPTPGPGARWLRALCVAVAAGLVAAVAADGDRADAETRRASEERETVLVLDASNSMLARDVSPSRLVRERTLALRLAERLPGRVGVVYFAGGGYVLSPLTTDVGAVRLFVESVRPSSVGRGGSALAAGLEQALDVLAGGKEGARKAVVLFSDGEETTGGSLDGALERAREAGVVIHAVGIGTEEGGRIPLDAEAALDPLSRLQEAGPGGYLRGPDGRVVVTRLEEESLRRIAGATGGRLLRATDGAPASIAARISAAESPAEARPGGATLPLLLLALGLLWAEGFLLRRA